MPGLGRFLAPALEVRAQATTWGEWPGESVPTWSGMPVSSESALQLLTVYGCVRLICDEISTLPIDTLRADPPFWLERPTEDLDRMAWLGQIMASLLLHGNAYVWIMRSARGIVGMQPLDPTKVTVWRGPSGKGPKRFKIDGRDSLEEILHIPGLMLPGADVGLSPVEMARQSIGLGLSAQQYGSQFFDGEGNMPGVIEIPGKAQPEQMTAMAEHWRRKRSRRGKGLPGVLESGATWKPTGVTNEQAQFLATRKFTAAEIAGQMFLLDPSDLGIPVEGTSLTYANLSQRNTRRVQVTLMPWMRRLEMALSQLIPAGEIKFNADARLRGDTQTSYETLRVALEAGFMNVPEVREILNLPPMEQVDGAGSATPREIAELIQKIYLGVDVVLSAEEARAIANRAGAGLVGPFMPPEGATPNVPNA